MGPFGSGAGCHPGGEARRARRVLATYAAATVACLVVALSKDTNPPLVPPPGATTDVDLYRRIVARVHQGEAYYDAAGGELRSHGYPTRSVFNWRTPTYAWLLGRVTGLAGGRWLMLAGAVVVAAAFCRDLPAECGAVPATFGLLSLVGSLSWCLGDQAFLFMELWAGVLIGLSVCAYRRGWAAVGLGAGLAALFYRELALPYAVVSAGLAVWKGRTREATAWAVGLAAFLAFMAFHAYQVHSRLTASDLALPGGWVRFGGIRFLLTTAQTNVFLMPLPLWCTAIYLPLAVLGLTPARGEGGVRVGLTVALFLAAFSVVGNPFNFYWGFITAPLLAVGIAGGPGVLVELITTALRSAAPVRPALSAAELPA